MRYGHSRYKVGGEEDDEEGETETFQWAEPICKDGLAAMHPDESNLGGGGEDVHEVAIDCPAKGADSEYAVLECEGELKQ